MRKSEKYAWLGTVITLISAGFIMFYVLMPSIEKTEEGGIMISFGNADDGAGFDTKQANAQETKKEPEPIKKEDLLTQKDKSVVIPETKKEKKTETTPKPKPDNTKVEQQKKEQQATQQANDLIGGSFGSSKSTGSGNTNSGGQAGNPVGKGTEGGNSWSLSGRNLNGSMPKPDYNQDQEGTAIVEITVDANGNVIRSRIIKGTISDSALRKEILSAANRTKFTTGSGVQVGTLTYNFRNK
jgi:TonB family protein